MVTSIKGLIALHEGRVPHAYQDSLGYWTIGVGHLIDKLKGGKLPERIIDDLLAYDISEVEAGLHEALPWTLPMSYTDPVRYAVLVDMAFNLGVPGLLKFKNTLEYVRTGQWVNAGAGMLASLWASQVGSRARRLANMMRDGKWPD